MDKLFKRLSPHSRDRMNRGGLLEWFFVCFHDKVWNICLDQSRGQKNRRAVDLTQIGQFQRKLFIADQNKERHWHKHLSRSAIYLVNRCYCNFRRANNNIICNNDNKCSTTSRRNAFFGGWRIWVVGSHVRDASKPNDPVHENRSPPSSGGASG